MLHKEQNSEADHHERDVGQGENEVGERHLEFFLNRRGLVRASAPLVAVAVARRALGFMVGHFLAFLRMTRLWTSLIFTPVS